MKLKHLLYSLLALSFLFAAVMGFLYFGTLGPDGSRAASAVGAAPPRGDPGTASGKGGRLLIAYAGDLMGSLDPCG